jgi:hypothetical protein
MRATNQPSVKELSIPKSQTIIEQMVERTNMIDSIGLFSMLDFVNANRNH